MPNPIKSFFAHENDEVQYGLHTGFTQLVARCSLVNWSIWYDFKKLINWFKECAKMSLAGVEQTPIIPYFTDIERNVLHALIYKSVNMTRDELSLLNGVYPDANHSEALFIKLLLLDSEIDELCLQNMIQGKNRKGVFIKTLNSLKTKEVVWMLKKETYTETLEITEKILDFTEIFVKKSPTDPKLKYFLITFPKVLLM